MRLRFAPLLLLGGMLLCGPLADSSPAQIEAVKGKQYRLSKKHGPWMIMVAAIRNREEWQGRSDGLTAQEAADELVFFLRKKGIPAYTFRQKTREEKIQTIDRLGRPTQKWVFGYQGSICVLAGNYASSNAEVAQKTLKFIKTLDPEVLRDESKGATFRATSGQPLPLTGAFLTVNPLLTPEELHQRQHDPLIARLNDGQQYSLLECPGNHSLVVASFYGKSLTITGASENQEKVKEFDVGTKLDEAAQSAWQIAKLLRQRKVEAYVYHDRHRSVVTVGSFKSRRDPAVALLARRFGAKYKNVNGKQVLTAELIHLPGDTPDGPPKHTFIFDPSPQLITVPKWK